jgi:hypothetical protein
MLIDIEYYSKYYINTNQKHFIYKSVIKLEPNLLLSDISNYWGGYYLQLPVYIHHAQAVVSIPSLHAKYIVQTCLVYVNHRKEI